MDPATLAFAIGGAGALANVLSQSFTNRANRKFALEMYERSRRDSLDFWRMQNEYNSPAAQMARYREAGLNPHLIYDRGSSGLAGPVQAPSSPTPMASPVDFMPFAGLISQYYDVELRKAQANNAQMQSNLMAADAMLRIEQIASQRVDTRSKEFQLALSEELRDVTVDAARENLRSIRQQIDLARNRDEREAIAQAHSIAESVQRVANMRTDDLLQRERILSERVSRSRSRVEIERSRAEIARINSDIRRIQEAVELTKLDSDLRRLELALRGKGVTWNDPIYFRVASSLVDYILASPSRGLDDAKKALRSMYDDKGNIVVPLRPYVATD